MTVTPSAQTAVVTIDVRGIPRPQGSMTLFKNGGGKYPREVYVWRGQLQDAAAKATENVDMLHGPVELRLGFDLPRPLAHYGTGRNAGTVKASAAPWPIKYPDLDKLVRCVCDALTDAGVWRDDSQVAVLAAAKRFCNPPDLPGVHITVVPL